MIKESIVTRANESRANDLVRETRIEMVQRMDFLNKKFERILSIDGEQVFREYGGLRYAGEGGLINKLMREAVLMQENKSASSDKETQSSGNTANNGRYSFHFFRIGWFKRFYLKKKFLNILSKSILASLISISMLMPVLISFCNTVSLTV